MTDLETLLSLARRKGTDSVYREWIKRQPSCLTGDFSEYHDGEGFSIPCHVRRASEAGTAYKPLYSCVPMRDDQHKLQSGHGEAFCLKWYLGGKWTVDAAKAYFDQQRVEYLRRWVEGR